MEEQHQQSNVVSEQPQQKFSSSHKSPKKLILSLVAIILIVGAAYGTYAWQHSKLNTANQKIVSLQSQLSSASKQSNTSSSTSSTSTKPISTTFTYTPQLGGLSLTLSKSYDVLVAADGNFGGAPGVDFKVVPTSNTNISTDQNWTDEAEIQIGGFTNLNDSVSQEEAQMQQNGDCSTLGSGSCDTTDFSVSDTTIGGQPAKLIIAKAASEYQGYINVYVGGLGQWGYTITSNNTTSSGSNNNSPGTLLAAVLSGVSLKQANWP